MSITYERNVEFLHYGVEGMKWGIRRYQNDDGSLTPLGRTRYGGKAVKEYNKATSASLRGKDKKALKHAKKFVEIDKKLENPKADKLAEELERRTAYSNKGTKKTRMMSDDEITSKINRMKVENEYNKLVKSNRQNPDVERTKEAAKSTAEKIGKTTVAALGTSLAVYFGSRAIAKGLGVELPDRKFEEMFRYAKPEKK